MNTKLFYHCICVIVLSFIFNGSKVGSNLGGLEKNSMKDSTYVDKIAFYSERTGNADIYTMNTDGSGLLRLTTNVARDVCPAISPDGLKIAFLSERDGNSEIYLMNTDGSNQLRITNDSDIEEHVSWSPDGTKIYFMKDFTSRTEIWVMNSDGTNHFQLTNNQARDVRPVLSPDGQKILFGSNRDGNFEIYLMNNDGSNQLRLTNTALWEVFPTWSPDGEKIAYGLFNNQILKSEIHVMNADGSGDTALTNAGGISEDPCWSLDGQQIVFQTDRDMNFEVYVMNSNGSNQHRITNNSAWDGWPNWGKIPVSTGVKDGFGDIQKDFQLYQNYPNPFNPTSTIAFQIPQTGSVSLKVYNVLGNEIETLVNEEKPAGTYEIEFSATGHYSKVRNLQSGVYFYQLITSDFVETRKMVLLK